MRSIIFLAFAVLATALSSIALLVTHHNPISTVACVYSTGNAEARHIRIKAPHAVCDDICAVCEVSRITFSDPLSGSVVLALVLGLVAPFAVRVEVEKEAVILLNLLTGERSVPRVFNFIICEYTAEKLNEIKRVCCLEMPQNTDFMLCVFLPEKTDFIREPSVVQRLLGGTNVDTCIKF